MSFNSISVLLPIYNAEKTLMRTLKSLAAQTLTPLEIIAIDDGSTDQSIEILNNFAKTAPCKVQIIQQKNQGASAARNVGIAKAKGYWLAFIDADDTWHPEKLAQTHKALQENKAQFLAHNFVRMHANGATETVVCDQRFNPNKPALPQLYLGNFIATSTVVVQTKLLQQAGGFNKNYTLSGDWDMWLRVLQQPHVKLYMLDKALTFKVAC